MLISEFQTHGFHLKKSAPQKPWKFATFHPALNRGCITEFLVSLCGPSRAGRQRETTTTIPSWPRPRARPGSDLPRANMHPYLEHSHVTQNLNPSNNRKSRNQALRGTTNSFITFIQTTSSLSFESSPKMNQYFKWSQIVKY